MICYLPIWLTHELTLNDIKFALMTGKYEDIVDDNGEKVHQYRVYDIPRYNNVYDNEHDAEAYMLKYKGDDYGYVLKLDYRESNHTLVATCGNKICRLGDFRKEYLIFNSK